MSLKTSGERRAHHFFSKLFQCLTVSIFIPWEYGVEVYPRSPNLKLLFSSFVAMNCWPFAWHANKRKKKKKFLLILEFLSRSLKAVLTLPAATTPSLVCKINFTIVVTLFSSILIQPFLTAETLWESPLWLFHPRFTWAVSHFAGVEWFLFCSFAFSE